MDARLAALALVLVFAAPVSAQVQRGVEGGDGVVRDGLSAPGQVWDAAEIWQHIQAWYDVTQTTSIGYSTAPDVNVLEDLSGNDYDLIQTNDGYRPTFDGTAIEGHTTLEFNGSTDYLTADEQVGFGAAGEGSFWVAFRNLGTSNADTLVTQADHDSGSYYLAFQVYRSSGGTGPAIRTNGNGDHVAFTGGDELSEDTVYVIRVATSTTGGGHYEVQVNGTDFSSLGDGDWFEELENTNEKFTLGAFFYSGGTLIYEDDFEFGELLLFDRDGDSCAEALTDAQQAALSTYLNSKWRGQ